MIRHNQPCQPPSHVYCHPSEFHLFLECLSHWDGHSAKLRSEQSNSHRNVPPILHLDRKHKATIFRAPASSCADEPWAVLPRRRWHSAAWSWEHSRVGELLPAQALRASQPPSDVSGRLTAIRPLSFPDKIKVLGFVDKVSSLTKQLPPSQQRNSPQEGHVCSQLPRWLRIRFCAELCFHRSKTFSYFPPVSSFFFLRNFSKLKLQWFFFLPSRFTSFTPQQTAPFSAPDCPRAAAVRTNGARAGSAAPEGR